MDKSKAKKIIKIIGNIVTIISVVFIVRKFLSMGIDINEFSSPKKIGAVLLFLLLQLVLILAGSYPWIRFVTFFSGKKIKMSDAVPVYTKSNILKYIPGNVFQFVGRNQLAIDMEISHFDVACATVADIAFSVGILTLMGFAFVYDYLNSLLDQFAFSLPKILLIAFVSVVIICILLFVFFRKKLNKPVDRFKGLFSKANLKNLLIGAAYYIIANVISFFIYLICVLLVFDSVSYAEAFQLVGVYMISWVIGFITPGAPGGIGIRESVMLLVCGSSYESSVMMFVIISRISSLMADFTAYIIGTVYEKKIRSRSE